jgi:hypothetical protein
MNQALYAHMNNKRKMKKKKQWKKKEISEINVIFKSKVLSAYVKIQEWFIDRPCLRAVNVLVKQPWYLISVPQQLGDRIEEVT